MSSLSKRRKAYDRSLRTLLYLCAGITCALLLFLIGYIFYRGLGNISWELLSSQTAISTTPSAFCRTFSIPSISFCWPWSLSSLWGWVRPST